MVELYVQLILKGKKTLDQIQDEELREEVRKKLVTLGVMTE